MRSHTSAHSRALDDQINCHHLTTIKTTKTRRRRASDQVNPSGLIARWSQVQLMATSGGGGGSCASRTQCEFVCARERESLEGVLSERTSERKSSSSPLFLNPNQRARPRDDGLICSLLRASSGQLGHARPPTSLAVIRRPPAPKFELSAADFVPIPEGMGGSAHQLGSGVSTKQQLADSWVRKHGRASVCELHAKEGAYQSLCPHF